jgi:outer membrane protein assembly factor BamE (lipoprotein component of BamABCDE complex)
MRHSLCIALALVASACAAYSGYNLQPGTSEEQVRQTMGAPAAVYEQGDGSRVLAYPKGPEGVETFMARVGADGRLVRIDQVLSDGRFEAIQPGLTEQQVLRMLGPPRDHMAFARSATHAWDYKYQDTWGYPAIFSVIFDQHGVVVSKFKKRLERASKN